MANPYHPDLRLIRWLPRFSFTPTLVKLLHRAKPKAPDPGPGVRVEEVEVSPTVSLHLLRPDRPAHQGPVLVWMHGGGHLIGAPEQDDLTNAGFVRELGISVAAVRYRLGYEELAPASIEDCYLALQHLVCHADELGVDPTRIAVGGASAGGGIAAGLAQCAHDRGEIAVALQLLVYPMLDDRTVERTDLDTRTVRVWTPKSNRYGWTTYLARPPGSPEVPAYAVPARREDLAGLPPAWIGVGTEDLFHDEDVAYAERLRGAGVACDLDVIRGGFHGFDGLFRRSGVAADFRRLQAEALRRALVSS